MAAQDVAAAWHRVESALGRRPELGLRDDAPATARWREDTQFVVAHPSGAELRTDMSRELGGRGDDVSPGWLLRAGVASCTATCISMACAARGIDIEALEVRVSSRSDTRGLLGMAEPDGASVYAGPRDMQMQVRISASGVELQRLRAVVEETCHTSPMFRAIQDAVPVKLSIDVVRAA
jgi:uncharacterized OsmC-like protein